MAYFYILGYWLLPRYLFKGKYVKFAVLLIALMLSVVFTGRLIDIFIANPYILKNVPNVEQEFKDSVLKRTFAQKIFDEVLFANALKMMHFVVWAALGIKLIRMWYERKQAALQAELSALKGQIHPHFLFNTLNNLYALTLTNSSKSSQVVLGLSDMLRYMLYECNTEQVSLQKEVLMLQQYISLEKLRYEDRIDLNFTISGDLENKLIAPLIMLTFIENAFKHGASDTIGQAWVNIDLQVKGEQLKLKVANSKPENISTDAQTHHGHIGLQNVRKRLELLYPAGHQLKILDDDDAFLVVLDLTIVTQNQPVTNLTLA
jgi:LytS/YehU family sensor histidine kinase